MANPTEYKYRPVDWTKREIRVLSFAKPGDETQSNSVHCSLENVLLDDFVPEFAEYLAKGFGSSCSPDATISWHKLCKAGTLGQRESSTGVVSMPVWRRDADAIEWNHLAESLGADTSTLFHLSRGLQTYINSVDSMSILTDRRDNQLFDLRSRFNWGDFEAVSYCWMSEVKEKSLIIDGLPLMVPKTVDAVLRRLRDLPEAKSGMKFWIDAICIDQDNTPEKNHQVNFMWNIYATAFSVVAWLGESEDGSETAIDYMTQIMLVEKEILRLDNSFSLPWETSTYNEWFSAVPWQTICSFLSRPYWTRLWIIQELALNHNATLFLCGNRQLTRQVIAMGTRFCIQRGNSGKIGTILAANSEHNSVRGRGDFFSVADRVDRLVWLDASSLAATNLGLILDLGQRAQSKDSRDKVYGLLGVFPEGIRTRIKPDYSRHVSQDDVYRQLCEAVLTHTGRVDSMLSWCYFRQGSSLPSWIPDWTVKFPRNHVKWLKGMNASRGISSVWSISADGCRLSCKGIVVDTINSLSLSLSENVPYGTVIDHWAPNKPPRAHRYRDENIREALRRTLSSGHPGSSMALLDCIFWVDWDDIETAGQNDEQLYKFWTHMQLISENPHWENFDRFRQMNAYFSIFGIPLRDFFPSMRSYIPQLPWDPKRGTELITEDIVRVMELAVISIQYRRLVTTQTGFLGLVPEETQQGDVIAVMYGCNFPVVLRPDGDRFKVVGECYVDGLMSGEAMEAKDRGEYQEVKLTLC